MKTISETERKLTEQLEAMGFALTSSNASAGEHPMLAYTVALSYKGEPVISTDYKMGFGHVDLSDFREGSYFMYVAGKRLHRLPADQESMLRAWARQPHANFKHKDLQMEVAVIVANAQGLTPSLPDVMQSLLSDGEAFFDAQTFEDWAANCGYDADSRKAEAIYRACDEIGRKLARVIPKDVLEKAREALQDY